MKGGYFPHTNPFHSTCNDGSYWAWNGVHKGLMILKDYSIWEIGNGTSFHIWNDSWIPDEYGKPIRLLGLDDNSGFSMVSELLNDTGWNMEVLNHIFEWDLIARILTITPNRTKNDTLRWIDNKQGIFSSKSLYNLLDKNYTQPTDFLAKKIWSLDVIPRIQFFTWKMKSNMLPFSDHLARFMGYLYHV